MGYRQDHRRPCTRHAGAAVCLVEREPRLGGDCTFYGCVPSKTLLALAKVAHDARLAADAGILDRKPNVFFSRVAERRNAVIAEIAEDERDERFADAGIEIVHGDARFAADHELEVGERTGRIAVELRDETVEVDELLVATRQPAAFGEARAGPHRARRRRNRPACSPT